MIDVTIIPSFGVGLINDDEADIKKSIRHYELNDVIETESIPLSVLTSSTHFKIPGRVLMYSGGQRVVSELSIVC